MRATSWGGKSRAARVTGDTAASARTSATARGDRKGMPGAIYRRGISVVVSKAGSVTPVSDVAGSSMRTSRRKSPMAGSA